MNELNRSQGNATPQRRKAYSLIRFSTPQQALGDSARRQYAATLAYCVSHNLELLETVRDEGKSGLHGVHRRKGAFGRFVKRFLSGDLAPDAVFIAEAFDRFTREPPRIAQQLFLSLINGGMDVVTLMDGQHYSADSIDRNVGQLFMSIGLMLGAHMESKNKGTRTREAWDAPKGRRNGGIGKETGLPSNIFPGWINKTRSGPKLDQAKAKTLHRIRKLLPDMGLEQMAKLFNDEGVPPLSTRKRPGRDKPLWDKTTIQKIIRGRQVLGEQQIGRYQDVRDSKTGEVTFKRVLTGEVIRNAYPAVFTEAQWLAVNYTLDGRRRGIQVGRNVSSGYVNLFGELARCGACGGVMKIRGRGSKDRMLRYLGCSDAGLHGCAHTKYHRLERYETAILELCGRLALGADPLDDATARLADDLAQARVEAADLEQRYIERFIAAAPGSLEAKALDALKAQHTAKVVAVRKLEQRLAATATPARGVDTTQRAIDRLAKLSGKELAAARGRIAQGLALIVRSIQFKEWGCVIWFQPGLKLDQHEAVELRLGGEGLDVEGIVISRHPALGVHTLDAEGPHAMVNRRK
jgi:DNA invertase Pin-like site-specific DNA recombinase